MAGYQVNLRSLDSEEPIVEVRGASAGGMSVPIATGDGFVVISLTDGNVSVITTGLNAEGIVNMLRRLHKGIPQIVEKLMPKPPQQEQLPPQAPKSQAMTQTIQIPTETLVKLLKGRGFNVTDAKQVDEP